MHWSTPETSSLPLHVHQSPSASGKSLPPNLNVCISTWHQVLLKIPLGPFQTFLWTIWSFIHTSYFRFKLTLTFIPSSLHSSCSYSDSLLYKYPLVSLSWLCHYATYVVHFFYVWHSACNTSIPIFFLWFFQVIALVEKTSFLSIRLVFLHRSKCYFT